VQHEVGEATTESDKIMANVVPPGSMGNASRTVDITPVRYEDRWLDDGADLEL
jgi:hypothetical protein